MEILGRQIFTLAPRLFFYKRFWCRLAAKKKVERQPKRKKTSRGKWGKKRAPVNGSQQPVSKCKTSSFPASGKTATAADSERDGYSRGDRDSIADGERDGCGGQKQEQRPNFAK